MTENDKLDFLRFLDDYLNDARDGLQTANTALLALEKDFGRTELLDEIFRVFHTLKSSSIMLEFADIAELARGKTGRVLGDLVSLLATLKGLQKDLGVI